MILFTVLTSETSNDLHSADIPAYKAGYPSANQRPGSTTRPTPGLNYFEAKFNSTKTATSAQWWRGAEPRFQRRHSAHN